MGRRRDKNETEHLKGVIRELTAENRRLKRKTASADKKIRAYDQFVPDDEEIEKDVAPRVEDVSKPRCHECSEEVNPIDLGVKLLYVCSYGHRKTTKKK